MGNVMLINKTYVCIVWIHWFIWHVLLKTLCLTYNIYSAKCVDFILTVCWGKKNSTHRHFSTRNLPLNHWVKTRNLATSVARHLLSSAPLNLRAALALWFASEKKRVTNQSAGHATCRPISALGYLHVSRASQTERESAAERAPGVQWRRRKAAYY